MAGGGRLSLEMGCGRSVRVSSRKASAVARRRTATRPPPHTHPDGTRASGPPGPALVLVCEVGGLLGYEIHDYDVVQAHRIISDSGRLILPLLHRFDCRFFESDSGLGALEYPRGAYFPVYLYGRLQEDPSLSSDCERFIGKSRRNLLLQLGRNQTTSLRLEFTGRAGSLLQGPYVDGSVIRPCRKRKHRAKDGGNQGQDGESHWPSR